MGDKANNNKKYRIHIKGSKAAILFPALLSPAIIPTDGCLTIILATEEKFYEKIHKEDATRDGDKIGKTTARKLHSQLVMGEWGEKEIFSVTEFAYEAQKRKIIQPRFMIYPNHIEAENKWDDDNYKGWYLGELQDWYFGRSLNASVTSDSIILSGYDSEGKQKKLGIIHPSAAKMYIEQGYTRLFQLNFKGFNQSKNIQLYEVAYIYYVLLDDKQELDTYENGTWRGVIGETTDIEYENGKAKPCCYTDPDDDIVNAFYEKYFLEGVKDFKPKIIRSPELITAHKVVGGDKIFHLMSSKSKPIKCLHQGCAECETAKSMHPVHFLEAAEDQFVQSRHPVYIPQEWKGRIGVMGDLHISSRQSTFKLVKPQVILGADEKDSPFLGPLAHESLSSVASLIEQIGKECDALAIVGDIYDHARNLDPGSCVYPNGQSKVTTADLWDKLGNKKLLEDADHYPKHIDLILFMEKIYYFYRKYKKPVIGVSGNHEGYDRPYGIAPYVGRKDIEGVLDNLVKMAGYSKGAEILKANDGLPADHNLTRYEATLLYGPSFGELGVGFFDDNSDPEDVQEAPGWNFMKENFTLLHCLFTPWADIAISYGDKYNFLCLGWGDNETILRSMGLGGGTLPRAISSINSYQLELLKDWTKEKRGKNIILSHFTFVCYDPIHPLTDEKAKIPCDTGFEMTTYAWGSFIHNRGPVYNLILDKKIDVTISGHTHRAGVYSPIQKQGAISFTTRGRHQDATNKTILSDRDVFLTCGSAGPYSKQNYAGEFYGQGLQKPQGMLVNFEGVGDESQPSISWVESEVDKLPRLAVVIDYMDENKIFPFSSINGEQDIFTKGLYLNDSHKFYFTLNPNFVAIFEKYTDVKHPFTEFALHSVHQDYGKNLILRMKMQYQGKNDRSERDLYALEAPFSAVKSFEYSVVPSSMTFMSINLNGSAYLAKYYDVSSPLCFPITMNLDLDVKNYPILKSFARDRTYFKGGVAKHERYVSQAMF